MREINIYEVLDKISDALIECDNEIIESIYNTLFDEKIAYIGDSVFVEIDSN